MNCLLDTHALIWYFENSPNIPQRVEALIDNFENNKYICSISLWEIAIKMNLGKLEMTLSFEELLSEINNSELIILQIENEYLKHISRLPYFHKDPFDRLIISTALVEKLTVITIDENILKYDVPCIW